MNNSSSVTDSIGLSVVIAASIFSPEVAVVVGPYVLFAVAGVIGASFALARRPPSDRWSATWYFLRAMGMATLLTVGISGWISAQYPTFSERFLLAPIALLIGFIDFGILLSSISKGILRVIDTFRAGGAQ
jgi:hypothetical protein